MAALPKHAPRDALVLAFVMGTAKKKLARSPFESRKVVR
jgi:hypothetical protein